MTIISINEKNNHDPEGNPCSVPSVIGRPTQFFITATGDGQGAYNLIGDYSASPADFYYQATTNYYVQTLLISISDNANFTQSDYGAIAGGLTNGVKLFIKPNGLSEIPLLSGIAFKKNYEWLSVTPHASLTTFNGLAQTLSVNFDVTDEYGMPITLNVGDRFIIRLNDNFSTLVAHTFGLRGRKV